MAGSNKIPPVTPRLHSGGSIPSGYVLGRVSGGTGPVELIPLVGGGARNLGQQLQNNDTLGGGASTQIAELGLHLGGAGLLASSQYYYAALAQCKATFPSASAVAVSTAKCGIAPTHDVTFYVVTNLTNYGNSGYPTGVAATVAFSNGSTSGTITWLVNPTTMNAGDQIYLVVSPTFLDSAIEGVAISLVGDYVSG